MGRSALPPRAGVGLKPDHYHAALDCDADGLWFEVHPENYMSGGGPRHAWLEAVRAHRPLSFHGVAASLGGPDELDAAHIAQLRALIERYEPSQVSEHVAWSAAQGRYFGDLFPLPYTREAGRHLIERIDAFQNAIGRRILIENPSVYIALRGEMSEVEFLDDVCRSAGCGLLLDVNNIYVSANNVGLDAQAYVETVPTDLIGEVHLAGHEQDAGPGALLIDSHAAPIAEPVWALYERLIRRAGPLPTLIERDANLPPFDTLMRERERADQIVRAAQREFVQ